MDKKEEPDYDKQYEEWMESQLSYEHIQQLKNLDLLSKFFGEQLKLYNRALDLDLPDEVSRISKVLENIHKRISEEQNRVIKYYKEDCK